jgi:hypothetical protein
MKFLKSIRVCSTQRVSQVLLLDLRESISKRFPAAILRSLKTFVAHFIDNAIMIVDARRGRLV